MSNDFNYISSYCGKTAGSLCTVRIARDIGHWQWNKFCECRIHLKKRYSASHISSCTLFIQWYGWTSCENFQGRNWLNAEWFNFGSPIPLLLHLPEYTTTRSRWDVDPLDLVKPDREGRVVNEQLKQKRRHDAYAHAREFQIRDSVFARNLGQGNKWVPATITARMGLVSYRVEVEYSGLLWKRHMDQICARFNSGCGISGHSCNWVDLVV